MSKMSLFLPMAVEYDSSEQDFRPMFGVTAQETFGLMMEIAKRQKADPEGAKSTDIFMELVQKKSCSNGLIMMLAAIGVQEMWRFNGNGARLALDATDETEEAQ